MTIQDEIDDLKAANKIWEQQCKELEQENDKLRQIIELVYTGELVFSKDVSSHWYAGLACNGLDYGPFDTQLEAGLAALEVKPE